MRQNEAKKLLGKSAGIRAILLLFLIIYFFGNVHTIFAAPSDSVCYFAANTGTLPADGVSICTIAIKIKDSAGIAMNGVTVTATSNRISNFGNIDVISYPYGNTTNSIGTCTVTISSVYSGTSVLDVRAGVNSETNVYENLCFNGSFEEADAGRVGGAAFWQRTSGSYLARITGSASDTPAGGNACFGYTALVTGNAETITSDVIKVVRNSTYFFSGYMFRSGTITTQSIIIKSPSDSVNLAILSYTGAANAWNNSNMTWTNTNYDNIAIKLYVRNNTGGNRNVYFDHVRFYRVPTLTFIPAIVSETASFIDIQDGVVPNNGTTVSTVTAFIRDASGAPMSGKSVGLYSSRGAVDTIEDSKGGATNTQTTDVNGACTWSITSLTEGKTTITAFCDNKTITHFAYRSVQGMWNFDTDSMDASGNANTATLYSNPSWTTGRYGYALNYDGSTQYDTLGYGPAIIGAVDFSVEAWIKTSNTNGEIICQRAMEAGGSGFDGAYRLLLVSGYVYFWTYQGGSEGLGSAFLSTEVVNDNNWHHIVVTRSSAGVGNIYIDGRLDNTVNGTANALANIPVYLGISQREYNNFFAGSIDEVRIYKTIPSASEVRMLYERNGNLYFQDVNETNSYIEYNPARVFANNIETCVVTAKIMDGLGSPLPGRLTTLVSSRGVQDTIRDSVGGVVNPQYTDVNGVCTWSIRTLYGYWDNLSLTVSGKTITRPSDKENPIGIWHFDNDILDSSGNGNNGYNYGAGLKQDNYGLYLDLETGNNPYVIIPQTATTNLLGTPYQDFSIEYRFKCDPAGIPAGDCHFFTKWGGQYTFSFVQNTIGEVQFRMWDGGGYVVSIGPGINISDGNWHHIAAVHSAAASYNYLYYDGVQIGSTPCDPSVDFSNAADLRAGLFVGADFNGNIDEAAIYPRALTDTEILNHSNRISSIFWKGTVLNFTASNFSVTPGRPSLSIGLEVISLLPYREYTFNDTVVLSSSSATGYFSIDRITWANTTTIKLTNGYKEFYYRDNTIGPSVITAARENYISDTLTVTVVNQSTNAAASFINYDPYRVIADNSTNCTVTVVINDTYGFPINGRTVRLTVTRSNSDTLTGNPGTTDPYGQCTFTIRSASTGFDTIIALCDNDTITHGVNKFGAIGIWHFDTDVSDVSGYGNNAALYNYPSWIIGKEATGMEFYGNGIVEQYVEIPHSASLNVGETTTSYSIEFWFRSSQLQPPGNELHFLTKLGFISGTSIPTYPFTFVQTEFGSIQFRVWDGVNAPPLVQSTINISDGNWHHVVGIRHVASDMIKLYIDGFLDAEAVDPTQGYFANTGSIKAGMAWGNGLGRIDIDELRIYGRILTETEVYSDYKERSNIFFSSNTYLNFLTPARTTSVGGPTPYIIIEAVNDAGNRDIVFEDQVTLISSSPTGKFSQKRGTDWYDISSVFFVAGTATVYYKDTAIGNPVLTIYRSGCFSDSQAQTVLEQTPHETVSYISFTPYEIPTDNISACNVSVNVKDTFGFPIPGISVALVTTKGVLDTINDSVGGSANPQTTDINGQCAWSIRSLVPGKDTITAICSGKTITRGVNKYGAVGIWNFDTDANDVSGYANNPVFVGDMYWTSEGYGSSLFDTISIFPYLSVPHTSSLYFGQPGQSFSVELWFRSSNVLSSGQAHFLSKQSGYSLAYTFSFVQCNSTDPIPNAVEFRIYNGADVRQISTKKDIIDGQWHHLVGIRDGADNFVYFYTDGVLTDSMIDGIGDVSNTNVIKMFGVTAGSDFKGDLDEIKMYNRALTDTEVKMSYSNRTNIVWDPTVYSFAIMTPEFTVSCIDTSPMIQVAARQYYGETDTFFNETVTLITSSSSGAFSVSNITWINTTVITFSSGVATFYYHDNAPGRPIITVTRQNVLAGTQTEFIYPRRIFFQSAPFTISSINSAVVTARADDAFSNIATNWIETSILYTSSAKGIFSATGTTWANTTTVSFAAGVSTFYYKDKKSGNPVITISRSDLALSDTQSETITTPQVIISKVQLNMRVSETGTFPMVMMPGDTIEYTIYIKNIGTETSTGNIITDTHSFDTATNNPVIYIFMDTNTVCDTWYYTTDTQALIWTSGDPTVGAINIKGLRWKIYSFGINESRAIRFRVKVR